MNRLFWFNPENDLALAAGTGNYTPPAAAAALRQSGVKLPLLWADSSDEIFDSQSHTIIANPALVPEPWGWSVYTRNRLLRAGMPAGAMPADRLLEQMRQLSHRRTAIDVLCGIACGTKLIPAEAFSAEEAFAIITRLKEDAVLKLPWSCSGRGVFYTKKMKRLQIESVVRGSISRQGSVIIEPRYDRLTDFAMLFHCDCDRVSYRGLSLFATDSSGNYSGNLIAAQEVIQERLGIDVSYYASKLEAVLSGIVVGKYSGWLGVDMMTYRTSGGETAVNPCVEVNLRMTMGVAALLGAESGRLPWEQSVLRVALAGEILSSKAIAFSADIPEKAMPLREPVMVAVPC